MLAIKNSGVLMACLSVSAALLSGCTPPGPRSLLQGERLIQQGDYSTAAQKLQTAVQLLPHDARAWNFLGLAYHSAGQRQEAAKAYQQALSRDRNLAAARFNLGLLFLDAGNAPVAVAELTTFTTLNSKSVLGWTKLGAAQLQTRQFDAAERSFNSALKLNAAVPEALNGLGIVNVQRRRYREGAALFQAALQQQRDYAPALLNLALVQHQYLGNRSTALQLYRDYLALEPKPANAPAVREVVQQLVTDLNPPARIDQGTPGAATAQPATNAVQIAANATATNRAPSPPPAHVAAATNPLPASTIRPEETTRAAQPAKPATDRTDARGTPSPAVANRNVPATTSNEAARATGTEVVLIQDEPPIRPAEDVARIPSATGSGPAPRIGPAPVLVRPAPPAEEKPGLMSKLNPLSWFRGEKEKSPPPAPTRNAEAQRSRPLPAINPNRTGASDPNAAGPEPKPTPKYLRYTYRVTSRPPTGDRAKADPLFAQGLQAQKEGRMDVAIVVYEHAVKLDPAFFEALHNLGLASYALKKYPAALLAYEQALAVKPDSTDARLNFALALQKADYPHDAADELHKVLASNSDDARAHFALARIYAEQLQVIDRARHHYQRVLQLQPNHPQATAIRYWLGAHP